MDRRDPFFEREATDVSEQAWVQGEGDGCKAPFPPRQPFLRPNQP